MSVGYRRDLRLQTTILLTAIFLFGAPAVGASRPGGTHRRCARRFRRRSPQGDGHRHADGNWGRHKTTSGKDGVYTVTNLRPGLYNVTVEAQGFRRFVQEGVRLMTGERIRLDVALTVGGVNEEVKVSADASLLRTETGSLGQVIPNRRIVDLPLNGRNFFT